MPLFLSDAFFDRYCNVGRVLESACFGTAPALRIFNPEPAAAPGKREQNFGFFKTDYELSKIRFNTSTST